MTLQPFQNRLTGPFQEGGDALSQPDAHAGNTKSPLLRLQLMTQCREESGAGTTERVPEGDGAALAVEAQWPVLHFQFTQTSQGLRGKGFIDLSSTDVCQL